MQVEVREQLTETNTRALNYVIIGEKEGKQMSVRSKYYLAHSSEKVKEHNAIVYGILVHTKSPGPTENSRPYYLRCQIEKSSV